REWTRFAGGLSKIANEVIIIRSFNGGFANRSTDIRTLISNSTSFILIVPDEKQIFFFSSWFTLFPGGFPANVCSFSGSQHNLRLDVEFSKTGFPGSSGQAPGGGVELVGVLKPAGGEYLGKPF